MKHFIVAIMALTLTSLHADTSLESKYIQLSSEGKKQKAFDVISDGLRNNEIWASRELGFLYIKCDGKQLVRCDTRKGLRMLNASAQHGDVKSQTYLGDRNLYFYSKTKEKHYLVRAKKWYTTAYKNPKHTVDEVKKLARLCEKTGDIKRAFELYKEGAIKGDAEMQNSLAKMYKNGEGTDRNLQKANYWNNQSDSKMINGYTQSVSITKFN